ncbi:hypothetical protein TrVE_jg165 [Triparma verrucosa]|uniref:Enolase-phosphatase E1 n=1 Tax=Triparma verrucosa TaxID=1606542 RepID=A0A9W6Z7F3_9STRA|nr:hypothetical protein TrVE_jg165 [Triparma verrucosa]
MSSPINTPPPVVSLKAIVLDIEGTCCPLSFVHDVLFPYALDNAVSFFSKRLSNQETSPLLFEEAMKFHTEKNRKIKCLKDLQSAIWEEGWNDGSLKSPIYADVVTSLNLWTSLSLKIYIYSSGSRPSQSKFFTHTTSGDLTRLISGFFDTECGYKNCKDSYVNIRKTLGCEAREIVFITDVVEEGKAAEEDGWGVRISIREGNIPISEDHGFATLTDFTKCDLNP